MSIRHNSSTAREMRAGVGHISEMVCGLRFHRKLDRGIPPTLRVREKELNSLSPGLTCANINESASSIIFIIHTYINIYKYFI